MAKSSYHLIALLLASAFNITLGATTMAQSSGEQENHPLQLSVQNNSPANTLLQRALNYYRKEQYPEALSDLNQAIKIDPGNRQCYTWRCMVYTKMGNKPKADEDIKALADMNPAIAAVNAAIKQSPHNVSNLIKRSDLYWSKGMLYQAFTYLDNAVKIDPSNAEALLARAEK